MNRTMIAAALVGIAAVVALIATEGYAAVAQSFASVGWGLAVIVALRGVQMAGAGLAWWYLLPAGRRPGPLMPVLLRWVREAVNTLLPVAQVGGDIVGARLLARTGSGGGLAGASVLVDLLTQTATQLVFALTGLAILAMGGEGDGLVRVIGAGLVVMTLAVVGFYLAQRLGGFGLLERALLKAAERPGLAFLGGAANLHDELQRLHDAPGGLIRAFLLHLVIWFVGALEILVALRLMGEAIGWGQAVVIESLGQAIRAAAFLVPGALGAQEGGLIALCTVYGISAPTGLALSLVKRVPEIVLGIPGLFVWHVLEGRLGGEKDIAPAAAAAMESAKGDASTAAPP
jgi:putative membrane protein